MEKQFRQQFSIKSIATDDTPLLENTLNSMSSSGWDLYSIYEAEQNSKLVYNCIFVRDIEISQASEDDDIPAFRSSVEKMLYSSEEPYELCRNLQKKINEKKEKIERVKKFLENSKDEERELLNEEIKKEIDELNILKHDLKEIIAPSKMAKFLGEEKLSINLSSENYSLCDIKNENNLLSQIVKTRQELAQTLGYIIPKVQFIENSSMEENSFSINIHGVEVICLKAYANHIAFFEDELNLDKAPKNSHKTKDPLTKRKLIWIKEEDCENFWSKGIEASEYIAGYLSYYSIVHIDEIFDYNDLNRYIDFVMNQNPLLVETILGDFISLAELKYLFVQLLREQVSVKDVTYIFEKLNDMADDPNKSDLLDKIRMALSKQISSNVSNSDKEIFAYELDDETISLLEKQTNTKTSEVKIELSKFSKLKKVLKEIRNEILNKNAILIVPQKYRQIVFILVSQLFIDVPVLCWEEIAPDYKIILLGNI